MVSPSAEVEVASRCTVEIRCSHAMALYYSRKIFTWDGFIAGIVHRFASHALIQVGSRIFTDTLYKYFLFLLEIFLLCSVS